MHNECSGLALVQHGSAGGTTCTVHSKLAATSGSHALQPGPAAILCKQDGLAGTSPPQQACILGWTERTPDHQQPVCLPLDIATFPVAALRPAAMLGLASHLHAWGVLPSLSLCHQAVIHLAHPVWQVSLVPAQGGTAAVSNC